MLAPIITPMAWRSVIRPALTKPTSMTVVALLLWMTAVTAAPTTTPLSSVDVRADSTLLILSPAARRSPSPSSVMPYKKRPRPPRSPKTISLAICITRSGLC